MTILPGESTVTAIASLYNSSRYIESWLADLTGQTLYDDGRLDIVAVCSGCTDDTAALLHKAQAGGVRLTVIETDREPMYASWNVALQHATGDYLTNTNDDDRHAPHALEQLADTLDAHPGIGVAYAMQYITNTPNATWADAVKADFGSPVVVGRLWWPDHSPASLTQLCNIGCQPMWRRDLHAQHGAFDESYVSAGDYEWWLRLRAKGVDFQYLDGEYTGLFLYTGTNTSADVWLSNYESRRAQLRWNNELTDYWNPDPKPVGIGHIRLAADDLR